MTVKKRSVLVRLLQVALVLFVLVAAWVGVELARGPVEPAVEHRVLAQPLDAGLERPPAEGVAASAALRVRLSFEEGLFVVQGGGGAGEVRVDAQYDTATYALETALEDGADGVPVYEATFRRKISMVRSLVTELRGEGFDSRVQVVLPEGVPLDLTLDLSKGEHRVDLSGLSVARLEVVGRMGEVQLAFGSPNPVAMSELALDASMGEFTIHGLGHANARSIDVNGSMGELRLGFEGALRGTSDVAVHVRMGSAELIVPEGHPLEFAHESNFMGELSVRRRVVEDHGDPGLAAEPRLRLDLSVSLGELSVR